VIIGSQARILVVENDPDAALFAAHVLTTRGRFDVTCTADLVHALHLAATGIWDLVLTELDLPHVSGLDLLRALRELAPGVPIVVLTARPLTADGADPVYGLADICLEKPIPVDRLMTAVTALL
jgi:DNA-binding response OmpR family regulator